jgi:hypothetical protein
MRRGASCAAALLVAAACGGGTGEGAPAPRSPVWSSGSRLRARVHDAGDGAVRFVALRCMPSEFFGSHRRYSDPGCTIRVLPIFDGDGCEAKGRTYVSGSAADDAGLCRDELFVLGKRVAASAYERDAKGACVASQVSAYFELTPASPDVLAPIVERVE